MCRFLGRLPLAAYTEAVPAKMARHLARTIPWTRHELLIDRRMSVRFIALSPHGVR